MRDPRMLSSSRPGGLTSTLGCPLRGTQFYRTMEHATQGGIPFWNQGSRLLLCTGNHLFNRIDTCGWLETGKPKGWMNWWSLINCTLWSLMDPKAIGLMGYLNERGIHNWPINNKQEQLMIAQYSESVKHHMRNIRIAKKKASLVNNRQMELPK